MTIEFKGNFINYNNVTRIYSEYINGSNSYYNICIYDVSGKFHQIRYEINEEEKLKNDLKQLYI